ncbi:MAG: amidohydrolase family protein [Gammaproteobacteria bacterium]|nr:amidohydrolase family protein [Gammaproteobacteria bacterium]NNF49736.1 amidohydrolase family protein [Woeseiaceae bacterium]MBT8094140.1 amidohydrolase family protein [Gammaproteobacteria bacterium]MBT8106545.1 amidohydrolase family protein [Gammaproteobacteria bacterium]NNK26560.1 amidohydrolase family protein [Woeseiaceae bacterium]
MNRLITLFIAVLLALPASAATTAIVGAKVHTVGPQGTIENGTVLIADGRIIAVGADVEIPAGAETIDASGKVVTPGIFSPFSQLGLVEVSSSAGPTDGAQRGDYFTAGFDVADAYNPRSTLIAINRIEGVTRTLVAPTPAYGGGTSSGHILSGLAAVVNLGDAAYLDLQRAAMVVTLGESGSGVSGGSRTDTWLTLRNALDEALDYRDHKGDFERGMRREYVHSVADLKALQGIVNGNTPLVVRLHRASDIEVLIRVVDEYGLQAIIIGGEEAWLLADELAVAGIAVVIDPTANLPGNFDRVNARFGSASILVDAGVQVAIGDGDTHNARNITQLAGNAVAHGLDWDAALRAITLTPAELFGMSGSAGSLEAGKAADVVIWPGDPLEVSNFPEQVFINGEKIPMVSRQTLLRDRYLNGEGPPAYRK